MSPDEAVEAVALVLDPQTMGSGGALAQKLKEETRAEARRILEAAAPHLMAQALNDAATALAQLPYVRPDAEGREEYERLLAVRRGNTDAWLRARADSLKETA